MNWRRLLWLYIQIGVVSTVSLFVFGRLFTEPQVSLAAVVIGAIAFVSLVLGGIVAGSFLLYYIFETVWRRVLNLAWPVMVEQTSQTLMRTTDVFITAIFSPAAVVAIGLSDLYSQFPLRIGLGLGNATIALSSQDTGRGASAGRDETTTQALLLGFLLGVPIAVVGVLFGDRLIALLGATPAVVELGGIYLAIILATAPARHVGLVGGKVLQGTGDTRTPMYITLFSNLLNISGSVILGLGLFGAPELGVVGVGVSTAAANIVSAFLFLLVISGSLGSVGLTWPTNPVVIRQLVNVGAPNTAEGFAVALARFPFNALLLVFGTEVNAGYQIGRRVYQQITAPLSRAYRVTASIACGQALGEGDPETARFEGLAVVTLGIISVGAVGIVLVVAAEPLARLFTDDDVTVRYSVGFIRAYGVAAIPFVVFISLSGSLQGAGETRLPLFARVTGLFLFFLGFSYLAGITLGYGLSGVYLGVVLSYVWMAVVLIWAFNRSDWAGRAAHMIEARKAIGD
jgi:putative MATE family efflux protein